MDMTDLRLARHGDKDALGRLLEQNSQRLARLAEHRLGAALKGKLRISDVVQSAYLDVVRGIKGFDGSSDEDFSAWVVRILENNIRDKGKYFGARKRAGEDADVEDLATLFGANTHLPSPSAQVSIAEDFVLFNRALANLSEQNRQVLELRVLEGLSYEDVAERLGRSVRGAQSLLSRARAALVLEYDKLIEQRRS